MSEIGYFRTLQRAVVSASAECFLWGQKMEKRFGRPRVTGIRPSNAISSSLGLTKLRLYPDPEIHDATVPWRDTTGYAYGTKNKRVQLFGGLISQMQQRYWSRKIKQLAPVHGLGSRNVSTL